MRALLRHPVARVVSFLAAAGALYFAGMVLVIFVMGAACCTGWDYVEDPNAPVENEYAESSSRPMVPDPPIYASNWVDASWFVILVLTLVLGATWLGWWAMQPRFGHGEDSRRWALRTRIIVWTWAGLVAAMFAYAGIIHARNWAEWHEFLAAEPDVPYEPDPGQVPTGTAIVIGAILLVVLGVSLLRARKRL